MVCKKRQREDKREFVTKSVRMIVTVKPSKTFATHCFFAIHLNRKTACKITRRKPSANPRQLWAHQLKSFRTVIIILLVEKLSNCYYNSFRLSGFSDSSGKVFLISFKFSYILLRSQKQEEEAGTNFFLLYQSRNMVGQFKKAYLHRRIKTHSRENSKMFNIASRYFIFFNNKSPAS